MRCEVAREALSARLDGEQQQVPAQRVDAHLESCGSCRTWLIGAAVQTRRLASVEVGPGPDLTEKIMATAGVASIKPYRRRLRGLVSHWWRWALIVVGAGQVAVAVAQIGGLDFGMVSTHGHGAATGTHLLHESTAWLLALGVAMIAAGIWTAAALGVAAIIGTFSVALLGYVAVDAWSGQVTASRVASHLPVLVGLALVLLVVRERAGTRASRITDAEADSPVQPTDVSRDRRRGQLRPINRSAA